MRRDGAWNLRDVEHTLAALLDKQLVQPVPNVPRASGRGRQEGLVSFVWFVVLLDEVPDIDFLPPEACPESAPRVLRFRRGLCGRCDGSHIEVPFLSIPGP